MSRILKRALFFTLASIVLNTFVYFGFVSNYTRFLFSEITYEGQYKQSIYKYRILGKATVLQVYKVLKEKYPENEKISGDSLLKALDPAASKNFYFAYFLVNTFMLVLCGILFSFIFENNMVQASEKERYLIPFVLIATMCLSQFVVVPYDMMAYFFLLLFAFLLINFLRKDKSWWFIIAGLSVSIATLNRETSALSVSLMATLALLRYGLSKRFIVLVSSILIFFIVPYVGLRIYLGWENSLTGYNFLRHNLTNPLSLVGFLGWLLFAWLSIITGNALENKKAIVLFHLFCLPYILSSFVGGLLFEIRLYIPIFITSIILAKLDPQVITRIVKK